MNLHRFDVQTIKNVELRRKPFKTAKLQKWSKYNDFHRFDVKTSKQRKTQNIKLRWICIDLTSKRSKMLSYVAKHSNNAKLQKWSNYNELHRFDVKTSNQQNIVMSQNIRNTIKTLRLNKSDQITMNLHRFDVTKHSKRGTSQNNAKAKDQITMNLHRFDVKTIKNVELRRKPFKTAKLQKWSKYNDFHRFDIKNFKTTQNNAKVIKLQWICIDLTSKWSKMLLCRKTFQTTENYKSDQIASTSKRAKCWVTSQKFKTTLNYKSDQNTMTCIDLMSKIQNNAKLESDQITMNLHRFDVQTIKNVELRRKPFKTAKLQKWSKYNDLHRFDVKSNHITMNLHRFDVKTN